MIAFAVPAAAVCRLLRPSVSAMLVRPAPVFRGVAAQLLLHSSFFVRTRGMAAASAAAGAGGNAGAGRDFSAATNADAGFASGPTRFIDIGANLVDDMYQGVYRGSRKHDPDLDVVLQRAWAAGLSKIIITGTSLEESRQALEVPIASLAPPTCLIH